MSDGLLAIMGDDGVFREYNDEFDITIHCESQEEQDRIKEILNNQLSPKKYFEEAIERILRAPIPDDYEDEYERAAFADGEGEAVFILKNYLKEIENDQQGEI